VECRRKRERERERETAVRKSLWHNQTHYRSLSLPAVYAANIDKECAYIFPFRIRNARDLILRCCVTSGHIFQDNQARWVKTIHTGCSTCFYTMVKNITVCVLFFAALCISVFSTLQQRCCVVLSFINNSVVQNAELNVTLAPDAVLPQESAVALSPALQNPCY